jgi:hypothetical protein
VFLGGLCEDAAPDQRVADRLAVDHADSAVTPVDEMPHPGPDPGRGVDLDQRMRR